MSRIAMCRRYYEELSGLGHPPYLDVKGEDIYNSMLHKVRDEWRKHQTILINECRLDMTNAKDRKFLQQGMDKFLPDEDYVKADGHVPSSA